MANENGAVLFIGCFEFIDDESDEEGTFQIVVEARDAAEAATRCRDRLNELSKSSDILGSITVYANVFVEVARGNLGRGVLVNHQSLGDINSYDYLPTQGLAGDEAHFLNDVDDANDEELRTVPPFWSGVDAYWSKWKLYWCETDDHDEDWFVVARNADDAQEFHEHMEGYGEDDARAELVGVLPATETPPRRRGTTGPRTRRCSHAARSFSPTRPRTAPTSYARRWVRGAASSGSTTASMARGTLWVTCCGARGGCPMHEPAGGTVLGCRRIRLEAPRKG